MTCATTMSCPAVVRLSDGRVAIIGTKADGDALREVTQAGHAVAADEECVVISAELFDGGEAV